MSASFPAAGSKSLLVESGISLSAVQFPASVLLRTEDMSGISLKTTADSRGERSICYVLARLGTENQSNRRIIPFSAP